MEPMEVQDAEHNTLCFHGHGERDAFVKLLLEHLEHPEPDARRAALSAIASHLHLTREAKTRRDLLELLKLHLYKESDLFLVQNLVKVLVDVALVPLAASHVGSCVGMVADVQTRDGVVLSTSSPLKRKGDEEKNVDENFAIARSVAQLLHGYLAAKDQVELGLRFQLLHSLLKIGEKTDGIVTWESLGFVASWHLRSSNPRVRALVLRLLVESVQERGLEVEAEDAKRRHVGDVGEVQGSIDVEMKATKSDDHETHEGLSSFKRLKMREMLLSSLVKNTKDPYPSVRATALKALVKLHVKGYELTSECCRNATNLFSDSFECVRIAAIEMVGLWMSHLDVKDQSSLKQRTEAFLQVCTAVTDMSMRVRVTALRVLGEATWIPDRVLLQTLSKKVAKAPKATNVSVTMSTAEQDGETGSPKCEEGANLLDTSAAGAFVHGLEDEYLEVRCAAIKALAKLACKCERMVFGAASLLLDMLNEEVEVLRMQAIYALLQLATAGYLSVHDQHLHLFLSVVEDMSPEMRSGGRNLLASSLLPSFSTFHSMVRALLTSLENHPEDEEGVISTFSVLGRIHPTYTGCITQELLQEMQSYLNEEVGLDEPRLAAILSLFLGAGLTNSNVISLVPASFLSYARFIGHKLPNGLSLIKLRSVGLKSVQFSWSNAEKRPLSGHVGAGHKAVHISNPVKIRESRLIGS